MTKQNTGKLEARTCASSTGSNRAEIYIPGTEIPRLFFTTIVIDLEKFLKEGQKNTFVPTQEVLREEARGILITAEKRLREYKKRWNYFQFYGCDVGDGFQADYSMFWATTDDGVIQLLRGDFLPIGMRAIDAEMDYLDGKLEPDEDGLLKPVEK